MSSTLNIPTSRSDSGRTTTNEYFALLLKRKINLIQTNAATNGNRAALTIEVVVNVDVRKPMCRNEKRVLRCGPSKIVVSRALDGYTKVVCASKVDAGLCRFWSGLKTLERRDDTNLDVFYRFRQNNKVRDVSWLAIASRVAEADFRRTCVVILSEVSVHCIHAEQQGMFTCSQLGWQINDVSRISQNMQKNVT